MRMGTGTWLSSFSIALPPYHAVIPLLDSSQPSVDHVAQADQVSLSLTSTLIWPHFHKPNPWGGSQALTMLSNNPVSWAFSAFIRFIDLLNGLCFPLSQLFCIFSKAFVFKISHFSTFLFIFLSFLSLWKILLICSVLFFP